MKQKNKSRKNEFPAASDKPLRIRTTAIGIASNTLLFILKLIAGILSGSIALISDAVNSLTDILASIAVHISVGVGSKSADNDHPFGHHRAEPIAGLIVAILTGIIGFEIISHAGKSLFEGSRVDFGIFPLFVIAFTIIFKGWLYLHFRKVAIHTKSIAIHASSVDHRNDVLVSTAALIGIFGAYLGFSFLDPLAGILISFWIIRSGFEVAKENMKFLMGETPDPAVIRKIRASALIVKDVKGVHDIKAHYVGTVLHAQVHVSLDRKLTLQKAHSIGKRVEHAVESIGDVDKAFVHIDPFDKRIYLVDKKSALK